MIVQALTLSDFRSYERLEVELERGLVLVIGANGAGKTNLLESLHVGTQGFSPRTRSDLQLVRFGAEGATIRLSGERGDAPLEVEVTLRLRDGKRASVNGARLRAAEQLRSEVATLVFTPDRLVVVKGGPVARRAYFDRVLGRVAPARAPLSAEYGAAVAQRNAALRRVAGGFSSRDTLLPWTEQVADLGGRLVEARREIAALLEPRAREHAEAFGLRELRVSYEGQAPLAADLEARLEQDLERGATGIGPHLHDIGIYSGDRELRVFGSQGEQRLAVLALLLAEAALIAEQRRLPPLLLLDDVLSELDQDRRTVLATRIREYGQALVTATSRDALPLDPDQLLGVRRLAEGASVVEARP